MEDSVIAEWYAGQHILVTGATGFMGKVLVAKILASCTKIEQLYILIRPKYGKAPRQRLEDFLNCPVFDKIRAQPNSEETLKKLRCVSGDVSRPNCNLSSEDEALLKSTVTVVFHMAANVKFDQHLKDILLLNTGGTLNLLELACGFGKLRAFVHVSTSYCHCNETDLEERLYKAPHNPRQMLELMKWIDDDILQPLTPKLLKNSPNTYAYTKCLTEQLVSEFNDRLPVVITRPSIVTAALKEPIPGWIDNLNGPTGILIGAGKGVIRSMHCNLELDADIVPVDMSINSLLLIAWKVGTEPRKTEAEVYHITASHEQPITWGQALKISRKYILQYPFSIALWYPGGSAKSSYFVHSIAAFFFHIIPAYFVDFMMRLTGNKPFLVRTQRKIQNGLSVLQYYTTRPWNFHNEKLQKAYNCLNASDKAIFFTNRERINYEEYLLNYVLGARKYCVREELDTLPYARKTLKRLYYLDVMKNIFLCVLLLWIFFACATSILEKIEDSFGLANSTYLHQYTPTRNA